MITFCKNSICWKLIKGWYLWAIWSPEGVLMFLVCVVHTFLKTSKVDKIWKKNHGLKKIEMEKVVIELACDPSTHINAVMHTATSHALSPRLRCRQVPSGRLQFIRVSPNTVWVGYIIFSTHYTPDNILSGLDPHVNERIVISWAGVLVRSYGFLHWAVSFAVTLEMTR